MPLGVDITASLMETALCDPSFWGPSAAAGAITTAAAAAAGNSLAPAAVSHQQLRMQYSAAIVRCVLAAGKGVVWQDGTL